AAGAVGVGLARGRALAGGGIAVVRDADRRRPGLAAPLAVADVDVADRGAVAGAGGADGAGRVLAALSLAVAGSILPAGRRGRGRAVAGRRLNAVRDERTDSGRALVLAGLARLGARAVSAAALDQEPTL